MSILHIQNVNSLPCCYFIWLSRCFPSLAFINYLPYSRGKKLVTEMKHPASHTTPIIVLAKKKTLDHLLNKPTKKESTMAVK